MDSAGKLSFGSDEQELGGRDEYDDYDGLDAAALEDSDDENVSNAFKGALLGPAYNSKSQKKGKFDDKYPSVAKLDRNFLEKMREKKKTIVDRVYKEHPKSSLFSN